MDDLLFVGQNVTDTDTCQLSFVKKFGDCAVLAEGDAAERDDIIFLEPLPLFNAEGEAI